MRSFLLTLVADGHAKSTQLSEWGIAASIFPLSALWLHPEAQVWIIFVVSVDTKSCY